MPTLPFPSNQCMWQVTVPAHQSASSSRNRSSNRQKQWWSREEPKSWWGRRCRCRGRWRFLERGLAVSRGSDNGGEWRVGTMRQTANSIKKINTVSRIYNPNLKLIRTCDTCSEELNEKPARGDLLPHCAILTDRLGLNVFCKKFFKGRLSNDQLWNIWGNSNEPKPDKSSWSSSFLLQNILATPDPVITAHALIKRQNVMGIKKRSNRIHDNFFRLFQVDYQTTFPWRI